eukprot:scaffold862_cov52-Phaeocystis_antarctica.AAC.4
MSRGLIQEPVLSRKTHRGKIPLLALLCPKVKRPRAQAPRPSHRPPTPLYSQRGYTAGTTVSCNPPPGRWPCPRSLGGGEANLALAVVKDGVVLAQKHVAQDPQWTARRRHLRGGNMGRPRLRPLRLRAAYSLGQPRPASASLGQPRPAYANR